MTTSRLHSITLVQDILAEPPVENPHKTALWFEDKPYSYAQLNAMSNQLAAALVDNGVKPGNRIILFLLNSLEAVVSAFAVLKANAVFSVVDYAAPYHKLGYIVADSEATAVITHHHQQQTVIQLFQESPSLKFAVFTGPTDTITSQPNTRILAYNHLLETYPPQEPFRQRIDRDLAYLVYTSGSTGGIKGVITTHHSSLFAVDIACQYLGLTSADTVASALPLSYSHGFNQLLQTLRAGATLLLEKSFAYPAVTLKRMEAAKATGFAGVPTIYAMLLKLKLDSYNLPRLRYVSSAGAPLPSEIIRQLRQVFPNTAVYSIYGMAEASNALGLPPNQIDQRPTSVGQAMPGTQVWLQNEAGERLGPGQPGELVIRGGHVRSGYWHNPQASAERFKPGLLPGEQICCSGDIFQMDDEGYFYFVGRSDEIIKSGGKKVAPKEIENVLYSLDGVLETAVVGIEDAVLGQVIKALVVPAPNHTPALTPADVLSHCRQHLAEFMVPSAIEIVQSLPKTASGKIKKVDLA